MKQIKNSFIDNAYAFVTESGLRVTIIHRPGFKQSVAVYGTPFGALDLIQSIDGLEVQHKTGVAHFLEHKLFEDETEDVFSKFAEVGASANAFTSHEQTVYYFSTNGDVLTPLGILIDFVSRFSLNQERVDKEKGIILEELRMYAKMPDTNLLMKTYQNVYHTFPLRIDIGGTEEDVSSMLLDDLRTAYRMNYTDSRMGLVITTGEDPQKIFETVTLHTQNHPYEVLNVQTHFKHEPLTVRCAYEEIYDNVLIPKMSVSYKFEYNGTNKVYDEYLVRFILQLNFSEMNDAYQSWLDDEIISDSFMYDVDLRDGFGVVYFFNDAEKPEAFRELIDSVMQKLEVNPDNFTQLSRRQYGRLIMLMEHSDRFVMNILSTGFKGVQYFDYLEFIKTLEYKRVLNTLDFLQNFDSSFLLMKPHEPTHSD